MGVNLLSGFFFLVRARVTETKSKTILWELICLKDVAKCRDLVFVEFSSSVNLRDYTQLCLYC